MYAAAAATHYDDNDNSEVDESQPLLSPPPPLQEVANVGRVVESQLTATSGLGDDFLSSPSSQEEEGRKAGEQGEPVAQSRSSAELTTRELTTRATSADGGTDDGEDLATFFDGVHDDDDSEQGMDGFSSSAEFSLNERCSHYMDRAPITSSNRHAVEVVYMIEVETLCCNENTMKLPELQQKIFNRYKSLIHAIPLSHFGEVALKESMVKCIKNSKGKDGSAGGHYTRTTQAKTKVQAIMRQLPTISKLPSGRDIIDVRDAFILKECKAEKAEVHQLLYFPCMCTNDFCLLTFVTGFL